MPQGTKEPGVAVEPLVQNGWDAVVKNSLWVKVAGGECLVIKEEEHEQEERKHCSWGCRDSGRSNPTALFLLTLFCLISRFQRKSQRSRPHRPRWPI